MKAFQGHLENAGLANTYEAAHARLAEQAIDTAVLRRSLQDASLIKPLPAASQAAADKSYIDTANKLYDGLEAVMNTYAASRGRNANSFMVCGVRVSKGRFEDVRESHGGAAWGHAA